MVNNTPVIHKQIEHPYKIGLFRPYLFPFRKLLTMANSNKSSKIKDCLEWKALRILVNLDA